MHPRRRMKRNNPQTFICIHTLTQDVPSWRRKYRGPVFDRCAAVAPVVFGWDEDCGGFWQCSLQISGAEWSRSEQTPHSALLGELHITVCHHCQKGGTAVGCSLCDAAAACNILLDSQIWQFFLVLWERASCYYPQYIRLSGLKMGKDRHSGTLLLLLRLHPFVWLIHTEVAFLTERKTTVTSEVIYLTIIHLKATSLFSRIILCFALWHWRRNKPDGFSMLLPSFLIFIFVI